VQPSRSQKESCPGSGFRNALACGLRMFMKPAKPQVPVDMASLQDNVFSFSGADFTPWLVQLNQINVALFLQQQLPDMPLDEASPKGAWSQPGSKQQLPQHGLPLYHKGYCSEAQNTGNSLSLTVR
jgi:hypothetical protein